MSAVSKSVLPFQSPVAQLAFCGTESQRPGLEDFNHVRRVELPVQVCIAEIRIGQADYPRIRGRVDRRAHRRSGSKARSGSADNVC